MELVLFFAALIIIWLVVAWTWKVTKATLKTGVIIVGLLLLLHFGFGITPSDIGQQLEQFFQGNWQPQR